MTHEKILANV